MLRKQPVIKFKRDKLKSHSAFLSEYFHTPHAKNFIFTRVV